MIPLFLTISGFLSYRDPVELDCSGFELACIAGPNGAGKSSLLDAITWVLFGQARKKDDSLINAYCDTAQVALVFSYEGNHYRVWRAKPRDKTSLLEFHIHQDPASDPLASLKEPGAWKPLTERSLRDTEARIQQTLRMDYETFVNASFFLQGKADQFTQQRPADRKRILSSILGLDTWEAYRQKAGDRRKTLDNQISFIDGRLREIDAELSEEDRRKANLERLQADLDQYSRSLAVLEASLESMRRVIATLDEQAKLVETLSRQLGAATQRRDEVLSRLATRQEERHGFADLLAREAEIDAAYRNWQEARARLERWEEVAARFREHEKRRQVPLDEINAARNTLTWDLQLLQNRKKEIEIGRVQAVDLQAQIAAAAVEAAAAEAKIARRGHIEEQRRMAQDRLSEAKAENPRLKSDMNELKVRIDQLSQVEGATCPICGKPLAQSERSALIESLTAEGKGLGDRFRLNKEGIEQFEQEIRDLNEQVAQLLPAETELRNQREAIARLTTRLEGVEEQQQEWEANLAPRLAELAERLDTDNYALEARALLAEVDADLKAIGYDAAAHDADRRSESEGRAAEGEMRLLEQARAALTPLDREIAELEVQASGLQAELVRQQEEHQQAANALSSARGQAPDLETAERELLETKEKENRLRIEVGHAQQLVLVLDDQRLRRKEMETEREHVGVQVAQLKKLERAFGKDGVPALLIEQALPQIELKANEILNRLTDGTMMVRFVTQAAYKDKRREDLKETLDIQISDGAGARDYELFSGGEAFRVNFAIRLALSEVLVQRAGARLQTLVIDEGFGSQDALGRQRLIEAINSVRPDFAKILVITHIDELKDAFPTRIEVEKTLHGSSVRVT